MHWPHFGLMPGHQLYLSDWQCVNDENARSWKKSGSRDGQFVGGLSSLMSCN